MKKKIGLLLLILMFIPFIKVKAINVKYSSHVQNKGWMSEVKDGNISGTIGQSLRMEAIKINIDDTEYDGSIIYQVHVQNKGWMSEVKDGEIAGTTGKSLRTEAIKIYFTGELSEHYSIFYRAHVQNKGWMNWVSDGEIAGTTGKSLRVEAIEIKLVPKDNISISYSTRSSNGWQDYVSDGETSGSTGKALSLDSIKINLTNTTTYSGDINYQIYNNLDEWQKIVSNNETSGKANKSIEAIKINLTGDLANYYNVFYRVHVSYIGWMGWTSNGNIAGTIGYFKNVEAIEIKILNKEDNSLSNESNSSKQGENKITYSSHVQNIGWQDYVNDGEISGTTGKNLRVEAYKIKLDTVLNGNISYKTYIDRRGWSKEVNSNNISGTTGLSRNIEAISIKLTGDISNYFDIYYRVHVSNIGWLSWTKNGSNAGCTNSSKKVEALQIKLVKKGVSVSLDTSRPYVTGSWKNNNTNYYDYFGNKVTGFRLIDGVKCYFNSEGTLYGKNVNKVIDVSSWQGDIDWDTIKKQEDVDAAIIRVGWGTSYTDECGLDSKFDRNIKAVQRLGIPYSIYIYAYAETTNAANKEATFVINKMKAYNIPTSTYVWYDAEISSIPKNTYKVVIPTFVSKMKSSGYSNIGVYSGVRQLDTTNGNLNDSSIRNYPIWVAQYYKNLQYTGTYKGWQYASDEKITGISGNVDVSMFKK